MTTSIAFTLQLLTLSVLAAQTPSKWCEYAPRSARDFIAHTHLGDSADVDFSGGGFPSRVTLRYTGNSRPLSSDRQHFLRDYSRVIGKTGVDTLFQHEEEFVPKGDSSWWLPIQETMLRELRSELTPGDTSTVFLVWAGSYRRSLYDSATVAAHRSREYLLLINEFTSRQSADDWSAVLRTCDQ